MVSIEIVGGFWDNKLLNFDLVVWADVYSISFLLNLQ